MAEGVPCSVSSIFKIGVFGEAPRQWEVNGLGLTPIGVYKFDLSTVDDQPLNRSHPINYGCDSMLS